jgi:hypothetical protein
MFRLSGGIFRFGNGPRYLVYAEMQRGDSGNEGSESSAFWVLDLRGSAKFSEPWDLERANTDALDLKAIGDVDGDGEPDIVFCLWPDSTNLESGPFDPTPGKLRVLGYHDRWYPIDSSRAAPIECDSI